MPGRIVPFIAGVDIMLPYKQNRSENAKALLTSNNMALRNKTNGIFLGHYLPNDKDVIQDEIREYRPTNNFKNTR